MIHAIAYVVFILPFTAWLGYELNRKHALSLHWRWILGAVVSGIIGSQIFRLNPDVVGNFLLHASGGVSSTLLFIYLLKTLKLSFNWHLATLLMFAFVCMLGVLNELAEYFFEFLGLGPFSFDAHDTWRDFVANTTGALVAWMIYGVYLLVLNRSSQPPPNLL